MRIDQERNGVERTGEPWLSSGGLAGPVGRIVASVVLVAGLAAGAHAQQDFSNVQIQSQKVAGAVHMLVGAGGNIGVSAGDDGLLIVDDQFAPLADRIRAALQKIDPGDLAFVVNSHWHGDHTGGNAEFGAEASIVAHANVRKRMSMPQNRPGRPQTPASPAVALPVVTFADSVSIHFNGEEIKIQHFPTGHTDGDSVIFFTESNVVHMGDHYFAGRFPFVDLASGGNALGLMKNISAVIDMLPSDIKIIPGHGPLSTLDDLELYHRMLEDTIATVRRAREAGKSLDDIKAAGFSDQWAGWGSGFIDSETWATIIYNSL